MSMPSFVVIGAMKSGTTTLHRMLGQHPQLFVTGKKELHFFDKEYGQGLDWYFDKFQPGPDQLASGETCSAYIFDQRAQRRIVKDLPDAKFLAVLREPVSRAYSHYWMNRLKGVEPIDTFEEAIQTEDERMARGYFARRRFSYVRRGRYILDLKWFEERVGRDRLHVFLMTDLLGDPTTTMTGIFEFLGVDPSYGSEVTLVHHKRGGAPRARPGAEAKKPKKDEYPVINPETKAMLRASYRDDNLALREWLGRDLPGWIDA